MSAEQQEQPPNTRGRIALPTAGTGLQGSLSELGRMAAQQRGFRETLTRIAVLAVRAIPRADGAGVNVFDAGHPDILVASDTFVRELDGAQYRLGQGPCITAAAEASALQSPSLTKDARWPEFGAAAARLQVHSALSLPLLTAHGVLGTINIYARQKRAFPRSSVRDGQLFALSAAIAVETAHLLHTTMAIQAVIATATAHVMSTGVSATEALELLQKLSRRRSEELRVTASLVAEGAVLVEPVSEVEQQ